MKKIFENVNGNSFKLLLTENTTSEKIKGVDVLRESLKKVFSQGNSEISYSTVKNMGFGFIKDVTQAKNCALQESKELASEYGYSDDVKNSKFVKENDIETVSYDPADQKIEKREVQIGKEIIRYVNEINDRSDVEELKAKIIELANELITSK